MFVTFDEVEYQVSDDLFNKMVVAYKVMIGYVDGQRIDNPMLANQYHALEIVHQVCGEHKFYINSLDHRIAIANAIMKAV